MKGNKLNINDPMPQFKNLPCVDGKKYSSSDFKDANILIIVFSCNHCPYVKVYEDRMIAVQKDYVAKGVHLVAINSNDERNYPDDNYDEMIKRAKAKEFNFNYLRDADQQTAEAFGATHTPQFFVFSAKGASPPHYNCTRGWRGSAFGGNKKWRLRYSGKLDDNWENSKAVKENYLRDALDALLTGKEVKTPETFSIGCTIKWKM
jgi:thiol-disulfide isomerase/thioredoxin